jgi:hypothetical protein
MGKSTVRRKRKSRRLLANRGDTIIDVRLSHALISLIDQRATDQGVSRSAAISGALRGWFMSLGKFPIDE